MNTRILFPLLFTVASFSASAGNWAVKNGWCQTMTEDGQALVMLKNGTIGITGLMQVRIFMKGDHSITSIEIG
ncbi:hypothetical protein [Escherichia coli]|uniref:hypothetical protein n=1 Tax=Escherichia coli TaxID=562 RepID=UPI0021B18849|nr:hypothetical protein [Escherichia coli]